MARIRSIKQDFFLNEDLATVSSNARLLAIGLWTIADKSGRLEDRPLKIKAQLFPYHNVDISGLLDELDQQGIGFIQRYSVGTKQYIQVTNFEKHQKPHPKEPDSTIPAPGAVEKHGNPAMHDASAVESREEEACTETNTEGSSGRNGSGNGSGNRSGEGDLGSLVNGDDPLGSAKAGASATEPNQRNFDIWTLGVGKLMSAGIDEQDARRFLGKQRKDFGDEVLSESITKMLARNPVDPKAYLVGVLQGRAGPRQQKAKVDHSMDAVQRGITERQARHDAISGPTTA